MVVCSILNHHDYLTNGSRLDAVCDIVDITVPAISSIYYSACFDYSCMTHNPIGTHRFHRSHRTIGILVYQEFFLPSHSGNTCPVALDELLTMVRWPLLSQRGC